MIIWSNYSILLHNKLDNIKCDLWEVESTQNHLGLIFKNCLKSAKLLICYFWCRWFKMNFDLGPVGFDRAFHELSKYINFVKFGSVDFPIFNFENSICREIWIKELNQIWIVGLRGKIKRASERKRVGPAQQRVSRSRPPDWWAPLVSDT